MFADAIREFYEPVSTDNTMYDEEGGSAMFGDDGQSLYDMIQDDWNVFSDDGEALLKDILAAGWDDDDPDWPSTDDTTWTSRSSPLSERSECLSDPWKRFCKEARQASSLKEIRDPNLFELLRFALENAGAELPRGRWVYRASIHRSRRSKPYVARGLGPPPPWATKAGRCNIEGEPVLYTAEDEDTTIKEVRPQPGQVLSIGRFVLRDNLRVLDTLKSPVVSSFFEDGAAWKVQMEKLLRAFGESLSLRVNDPEITPGEYHATQILARIVRDERFAGIRYQSGRGSAANVVLFDHRLAVYVDSWMVNAK